MKLNYKKSILILFSFLGLFFLTASFLSAQLFEQKIISPFGHEVRVDSINYPPSTSTTKKETTRVLDSSYSDFDEYGDPVNEPYCRLGGMYEINVGLDLGFSPRRYSGDIRTKSYARTFDLFYCKTIQDLIERIQIPQSWSSQDSNLVLYCNDGGLVQSKENNYDLFTSNVDNYKLCILKNLDLDSNNTIVYGFEVGNKIVDNVAEYFFDFNDVSAHVLDDLEFNRTINIDNSYQTDEIYSLFSVDYEPFYVEVCYDDSGDGGSWNSEQICNMELQGYKPMNESAALKHAQNEINSIISRVDLKDNYPVEQDCSYSFGGGDNGDSYDSDPCFDPGPDSYSIYIARNSVNWSVANFEFRDKFENSYYFNYNNYSKFYSLSSTSEDLTIPITEHFPKYNEINLSRVALFKKTNGKTIYGYEQNSRERLEGFEEFENNIKPVYVIDLGSGNFNFYTKDDCLNLLGVYNPVSSVSVDDIIVCNQNKIELVSSNINGDITKIDETYHFFKNIILNLK